MDQYDEQPMLPLDERFRRAQQYSFDMPLPEEKKQVRERVFACIGNCNICPRCGNSNNRDK